MSVLTNNGYIVESDIITEEDINELTVIQKQLSNQFYNESVIQIFLDNKNGTMVVPRYWAEEKFGYAEDMFTGILKANITFNGLLKSSVQIDAKEASIEQLKRHGGGVLSLPTGTGKTVIALNIACTLKLKTLIIVHKQILLDQWTNRIEQFVPSATIGRIQQNTVNIEDCDIVVGMLQSIALRDYILSGFGFIIFDEVHVVPAPVFSRVLLKLCAPYMLGLSATPDRKDGLSQIIYWFIGPIFFEHTLSHKSEVTVFAVEHSLSYKFIPKGKQICMATTINMLSLDQKRNELIIRIVSDLATFNYKIIILSDRRNHCILLKEQLEKVTSVGLYLGCMKRSELEESQDKNVIIATYGMAKEGLDIPSLNALVLAHPRSDVVQACGRILHSNYLQNTKNPVIIDIIDNWFMGRAQFNKRQQYYKNSGFVVKFKSGSNTIVKN